MKPQRAAEDRSSHPEKPDKDPSLQHSTVSHKRKRDSNPEQENDSKLQEYLEVMQPSSKSRMWANEDLLDPKPDQQGILVEDRYKEGVVAQPNVEADLEYQEVPRKRKARSQENPKHALPSPTEAVPSETIPGDPIPASSADAETRMDAGEPAATDDDWLRSRTSRLLGLIDDDNEDLPTHQAPVSAVEARQSEAPGVDRKGFGLPSLSASARSDSGNVQDAKSEALLPNAEGEATTITAGRLFIRNLPYTATEDDLQQFFGSGGNGHFEEVRMHS